MDKNETQLKAISFLEHVLNRIYMETSEEHVVKIIMQAQDRLDIILGREENEV